MKRQILRYLQIGLLTASPLVAQNSIFFEFPNSTIKSVTIGSAQCYFWFRLPLWYYEIACYTSGTERVLHTIQVGIQGDEINQIWTVMNVDATPSATSITWLIKPNKADPSLIDFDISGRGPDDTKDDRHTGTF